MLVQPADPPALRAAARLGVLVGRGLLSGAECVAPLLASAAAAAPAHDPSGLRARLLHALGDAAGTERLDRADAAARVRAATRDGLAAGRPAGRVRAAAISARGVLSVPEAEAIAVGELRRRLARGARHG